MNTIDKQPKVATLQHRATPYRGEWVIDAAADHHYTACHEVEQLKGDHKIVERFTFRPLSEAQTFSGDLRSHGWSKIWIL